MIREELERRLFASLRERFRLGWPSLCWPIDAALREIAVAAGMGPAAPPKPGEAWLVAVEDGCLRPSLWQLTPEAPTATTPAATFADAARASLELAGRLSLRDLAVVARLERLDVPSAWSARRIVATGSAEVLRGPSFGLAMCLATASRYVDLPVPAGLLASARVEADGSIHPIDGLRQKVEVIADDGLGIETLLVASSQARAARKALCERGADGRVEVVGVGRLADAYQRAFPQLQATLTARWAAEPALAAQALDELFRATVHRRFELLHWGAMANSAAVLSTHAPLAARAEVVRRIAHRHMGETDVRLEWPGRRELRAMPLPLRLGYIAHMVQSAADHPGDGSLARHRAEAARGLAGKRGERHPHQLRLSGAIGRALVRSSPSEAAAWLRHVVEDWIEIDEAHEASFAFGGWCHARRLLRSPPSVEQVREWISVIERDTRTTSLSRSFARIDAATMWSEHGRPEEALRLLDATDVDSWALVRMAERLRQLVRAHDALGRSTEADGCLDRLEALGSNGKDARVQLHLAELARSVQRNAVDTVRAGLAALEASGDHETALVLSTMPRAATITSRHGREFLRRYRY